MGMCNARLCARKGLKAYASGSVLMTAIAANILTAPIAYAQTSGATAYTYDELGRVRSASYSNGSTTNYTYDAAGNRTQVVHFNNNHNPVANADSASTGYNSPVTLDPRANDSDPDGDPLTITGVGTPSHGAATYTGTSVTYTPNSGYYGSDSFTYTISDGRGGTASATITVSVATPPAPVSSGASISTAYNTAGSTPLSISGVYSSTAIGTAASHGTASVSGATASYMPTSGYYGSDSFTYTATGPGGTSSPSTVTVSVATPPAPTANNASINTSYNTAGSTSLSIGGVYSSTSIVVGASHGTASVSGATASYTPTSGYYGSDSFTYKATGPGGSSSPATVTVNVATPAAPTAGNVSLATAYNTAGSTSLSISGVYSSTTLASNAVHGTASISGTTASYTPNSGYYGSDSFTYTASGPGGTSAPATVTVSVATPGTPVANNASISTAYNTAGSTSLSISGVYSSTALASNASHGTASISGTTASYTPNSGYYGSDSFTYTATGPGGTSAPATVSVNVTVPAAPTANNVSLSTAYNTAGSTSLSIGGVYSSTVLASNASHGTASISGATASYAPNSGYYGSDSFTYTATGPGGTSAPATVSVNVAVPAAPTANNVSLSTAYNTAGSTSLSIGGVYSSTALVSGASHGSASVSGTTASYTPNSGYYGSDSFTYNATGPGGTSSAATVNVSVAVPAAPTVGGTSITTPYNTTGSGTISVNGVYSSTAISANPAHGSASISGTTVTYSPTSGYSGSDSFSVTASGPGGTSAPATVNVTVQPNPVVTINLTSASNLRTLANNAGYNGASGVQYQFVVPAGTTLMGSSGGGAAIDTGTWPTGVTLSLIVNGNVFGGGGNGGAGSNSGAGGAGSGGGDAVTVHAPISVTVNSGGAVEAGGGGGGGGGYVYVVQSHFTGTVGGEGGGGGFPDGIGGPGSQGSTGPAASPGANGTTSGGGAGGTGGPSGGAGGNAASAGAAGATATGAGGAPGPAGYAIRFNGNSVGVSNNGTIAGTQG
jgi:hypothetical protein